MSSNFNPVLAPLGKHLCLFSIALTDKETCDDNKVNRVVDEVTAFMQKNFTTYLEDMDWELWTASAGGYGVCPLEYSLQWRQRVASLLATDESSRDREARSILNQEKATSRSDR